MNQNKFTQPHVRAKLVRSGAVETFAKAINRMLAFEWIERGLAEELANDVDEIECHLRSSIKDGSLQETAYSVLFLLDSLPKKHAKAVMLRTTAKKINELIERGKRIVDEIADSLPLIDGIRYRTRGKVNLILAQLPV